MTHHEHQLLCLAVHKGHVWRCWRPRSTNVSRSINALLNGAPLKLSPRRYHRIRVSTTVLFQRQLDAVRGLVWLEMPTVSVIVAGTLLRLPSYHPKNTMPCSS